MKHACIFIALLLPFLSAGKNRSGTAEADAVTTGSVLPKEYYVFTSKADSLFKAKDYKNSGIAFSAAFKTFGNRGRLEDRYYAAKAWSLANYPDSAFFQLFRITERAAFKDLNRVTNEKDFGSLHSDQRWDKLLKLIKMNRSYNFGFELVPDPEQLPDQWFQWGTKDYLLKADSSQHHSGKYSLLIEPMDDLKAKSFGCIAHAIDTVYAGKEVEVRAYIKMEHVDERIGLLLRIDGKDTGKSLAFDNMERKHIHGTSDWTQYSVKLPLPKGAIKIYVGAILSGTGKIWVDDFQFFVDGKEITDLPSR